MKKILALTSLLLTFAGSAFAASDLATHVPSDSGAAIYGGSTSTIAQNATNPVVKLSTGVKAIVNFDTAQPITYSLTTKHSKGSKIFGTANDSTAIYWFPKPAGDLVVGDVGAQSDNAAYTGGGWTTY